MFAVPSGRVIACEIAHRFRDTTTVAHRTRAITTVAHVAAEASGAPRETSTSPPSSHKFSPEVHHIASVSQSPVPPSLVTPASTLANSSSSSSIATSSLVAGALGSAAYLALRNALSPSAIRPVMVPLDPPSGIVPRATSAAPEALATMAATFPRAVQEEAFLRAVATELSKLGFKRRYALSRKHASLRPPPLPPHFLSHLFPSPTSSPPFPLPLPYLFHSLTFSLLSPLPLVKRRRSEMHLRRMKGRRVKMCAEEAASGGKIPKRRKRWGE
ncbi:unnamed protein product [Closterium sp. NIES-53]